MNVHQHVYVFVIFKLLYQHKLRELKKHFASKTPYSAVENVNVDETKKFGKPYKIWMVIRHGSRFASIGQVNKMNAKLPQIQRKISENSTALSNFEMKLLRCATIKFRKCNCSQLTPVGRQEMNSLATRTQKRFPSLLLPKYDKYYYQFRLTDSDRTLESAQQFALGLFGQAAINGDDNPVEFIPEEKLLRFYKKCAKWRNEIRYNSSSLKEQELFQKSPVAVSAVKKFNQEIGLNDILTFSKFLQTLLGNVFDKCLILEDIEIIYKACITEACVNEITAWCVPLGPHIIEVIEFSEDLKHYWLDGYGFEISYKQVCPLFKDMIDYFSRDDNPAKVVLNFTHSGALLKFISHLQLYKDIEPLKHNNYNNNRKWRISKVGGFGSNIIFVLYKMNGRFKILVLHQEKIIRLPCCPNDDLCDFDVIRKYYTASLLDCDFDKICDNF